MQPIATKLNQIQPRAIKCNQAQKVQSSAISATKCNLVHESAPKYNHMSSATKYNQVQPVAKKCN